MLGSPVLLGSWPQCKETGRSMYNLAVPLSVVATYIIETIVVVINLEFKQLAGGPVAYCYKQCFSKLVKAERHFEPPKRMNCMQSSPCHLSLSCLELLSKKLSLLMMKNTHLKVAPAPQVHSNLNRESCHVVFGKEAESNMALHRNTRQK